jgi:FixJ family two-component response regulator
MSQDPSIVFVVDDHASIRAALESLMRSVGHEVRTFASTQDFLAAERADLPGCLVLDVRLPGTSGLQFQRELEMLSMQIPIIFVTGHGDIEMSVAAMKAGALEFLTKPIREQALLDAVHRGIALDRRNRAEAAMLAKLHERFATLTLREREVMPLVAAGLVNKQIAAELGVSEVTVKVHRAQVMQKMQARSLPDLVRIADRLTGTHPKA